MRPATSPPVGRAHVAVGLVLLLALAGCGGQRLPYATADARFVGDIEGGAQRAYPFTVPTTASLLVVAGSYRFDGAFSIDIRQDNSTVGCWNPFPEPAGWSSSAFHCSWTRGGAAWNPGWTLVLNASAAGHYVFGVFWRQPGGASR